MIIIKINKSFYPIKKINSVLLCSMTSIALPTDNFQGNDSKTVDICFVRQITPHCIFRCHIPAAKITNISNSLDWVLFKRLKSYGGCLIFRFFYIIGRGISFGCWPNLCEAAVGYGLFFFSFFHCIQLKI